MHPSSFQLHRELCAQIQYLHKFSICANSVFTQIKYLRKFSICTNSVCAQIQYLHKFGVCTKNIGERICIMWHMIWMICTLSYFRKSDHRVNSRSGSVLGRLWLHRIFQNILHIDSYTKYQNHLVAIYIGCS